MGRGESREGLRTIYGDPPGERRRAALRIIGAEWTIRGAGLRMRSGFNPVRSYIRWRIAHTSRGKRLRLARKIRDIVISDLEIEESASAPRL